MFESALAGAAGLVAGWLAGLLIPKSFRDVPLGGPPVVCAGCREPLPSAGGLSGIVPGRVLRCPQCGRRTWTRPLVSAVLSAALFVACYMEFDDLGQALLGGFFCTIFVALSLADIERRLLPNRIVYPATLLAAATAWLLPEMGIVDSLLGALLAAGIGVGLFLFSIPFGPGAFGVGDVKVIFLMGFLLGPAALAPAVIISTLSSAVFAGGAVLSHRLTLRDYIPHGPFLALGGIIGLLWGNELWDWYAG